MVKDVFGEMSLLLIGENETLASIHKRVFAPAFSDMHELMDELSLIFNGSKLDPASPNMQLSCHPECLGASSSSPQADADSKVFRIPPKADLASIASRPKVIYSRFAAQIAWGNKAKPSIFAPFNNHCKNPNEATKTSTAPPRDTKPISFSLPEKTPEKGEQFHLDETPEKSGSKGSPRAGIALELVAPNYSQLVDNERYGRENYNNSTWLFEAGRPRHLPVSRIQKVTSLRAPTLLDRIISTDLIGKPNSSPTQPNPS